MDDCIFCRIAARDIPSDVVLEDDAFVAFRDIDPQAPQHVLVIPKEHITSLNDLEQWQHCEGHALLEFIVEAARLLGVGETGYRALVERGSRRRPGGLCTSTSISWGGESWANWDEHLE